MTRKQAPDQYLYISVFFAGVTTLGIELSAMRLLGNIFGTSNIVIASIIGLILLYLSAGYFIGGRWADRSAKQITFFQIMAWAAFTVGLIPTLSRPVLLGAARAVVDLNGPVVAGAFLGTMLLFSVPVTLLGCISPFAIRLLVRETTKSGGISGRVYAISTMGSLLGSFMPVLIMIPLLGTRLTYLAFSASLTLVALIGLIQVNLRRALFHFWMLAVLLAIVFWTPKGSIRPTPGTLYETESSYNYIQVVERGQTRYLLLNEGQGVHSVYDPAELETGGTWDYFLAAPFFNPVPFSPNQVTSLAIVGLAAGTIARQYSEVFGPIPIDGIEIDQAIIDAGQIYFDMNATNINLIVQDGRLALAQSRANYSVICVDAYRLPYIPWHLTTVEFFSEARDHLEEDGVLVINVGRTPKDRRLVNAISGTLRAVFPSVHVIDVPNTFNSVLVATLRPTQSENLSRNLAAIQSNAHPFLIQTLNRSIAALQPTPKSEIVFTDDHAPVERLTNSIMMAFLLDGGLDNLLK